MKRRPPLLPCTVDTPAACCTCVTVAIVARSSVCRVSRDVRSALARPLPAPCGAGCARRSAAAGAARSAVAGCGFGVVSRRRALKAPVDCGAWRDAHTWAVGTALVGPVFWRLRRAALCLKRLADAFSDARECRAVPAARRPLSAGRSAADFLPNDPTCADVAGTRSHQPAGSRDHAWTSPLQHPPQALAR